jgi:hypothetical protein
VPPIYDNRKVEPKKICNSFVKVRKKKNAKQTIDKYSFVIPELEC